MSRISLTHLTFAGANVPSASIEFGDALTVIYGASDTGKSYVVEALDYMLGAGKLRKIPERAPYSHVLLGLRFDDNADITLMRAVEGGRFSVFNGVRRIIPVQEPDDLLASQHGKGGDKNLSRFLLSQLGMGGLKLKKNAKNETRDLSFRDIMHVALVDETRMQAPRSPVLASGQYTSATSEKSAFRVLLTGEDDALLSPDIGSDKKRSNKAKIEVLDSVIADLAQQVTSLADPADLRRQLDRLNEAINEISSSVSGLDARREVILSERNDVAVSLSGMKDRVGEVHDLLGRFNLLNQQYESDLARLDMVEEAGSLLGYLDVGVCVFCGAEPRDQHLPGHVGHDVTRLAEAVDIERSKTGALRSDLLETIADLNSQQVELERSSRTLRERGDRLASELSEVEALMQPAADEITELLDMRSSVERGIGVFEQIEKLENFRKTFSEIDNQERIENPEISVKMLREFTDIVKKTLDVWNVPESSNVTFDLAESDLLVGDQPRSSRGKGMRAILHAGFTVSLAKYCLERDLWHPGFVILDSPVVTYRGPSIDRNSDPNLDEFMSTSVAGSLYRNIDAEFEGQAIVVENVTPPAGLSQTAKVVEFTGSVRSGRYGLFPPLE